MAIISAKSIIALLSLFHITLAFFFLTAPGVLADQTLVFIIGEAMGLSWSKSFESQSPPLAFLAAVLFLLGVSDLISLSQPVGVIELHWGVQAPVRLVVFFSFTFYAYSFSQSSPMYTTSHYSTSSWGEDLKNRVFFTWAFTEMIAWFWVYVTMREERRGFILRLHETKIAEGKES